MNIGTVIAVIIIVMAIAYVVYTALLKVTAFKGDSSCAGDCGCDSATKKPHRKIEKSPV